jgi:hypothetical protein
LIIELDVATLGAEKGSGKQGHSSFPVRFSVAPWS